MYAIKCKTLSHLCSIFLIHWLNQYTHMIMKYTRCRNVKLWKTLPDSPKKTQLIIYKYQEIYCMAHVVTGRCPLSLHIKLSLMKH